MRVIEGTFNLSTTATRQNKHRRSDKSSFGHFTRELVYGFFRSQIAASEKRVSTRREPSESANPEFRANKLLRINQI